MSKTTLQKTQAKIVEKAEQMIRLRGYEGTSLNDLVAKAGVSKGAFFHYYPNKQAISAQIIDKYAAEQLVGLAEKHLTGTSSVKAGIRNWIGAIYETYKAYGFKGGCLMGNLALELSDQNEAAREAIKGHFLELENLLVSYLKPAEAQGKLAMESRQLARLLIASIQGMTLLTKVHKDNNRAGREFMAIGQLIDAVVKD